MPAPDDSAPERLSGLLLPRERARPARGLDSSQAAASMKIGEVAERVGMSLRSMRYYEEEGLITPAGRTRGGFRLYSERDVQRLLLIMQMKPLGYTLEAMREVLGDLDTLAASGPGDPGTGDTGDSGQRGSGQAGSGQAGSGQAGSGQAWAEARARLERLAVDVDERYAVAERRLEIAAMFRDHLRTELDSTHSTDGSQD